MQESLDDAGRPSLPPVSGSPRSRPSPGVARLGLGRHRDGVLLIPGTAVPAVPLLLMLHGAGGNGLNAVTLVRPAAESQGVAVLAPDSLKSTWDLFLGGFGADLRFIQRALDQTLERLEVDRARLAIAGFSDGASYALAVGLRNTDVFGDVLAFSPGFLPVGSMWGVPRVFLSHGAQDPVLPIDVCSRRIAPKLRAAGVDLEYVEFDGAHVIPRFVAEAAMSHWLGAPPARAAS